MQEWLRSAKFKLKVSYIYSFGVHLFVQKFFFVQNDAVTFILLGKLAGKHEYVCNVHLSKMSPFWLK